MQQSIKNSFTFFILFFIITSCKNESYLKYEINEKWSLKIENEQYIPHRQGSSSKITYNANGLPITKQIFDSNSNLVGTEFFRKNKEGGSTDSIIYKSSENKLISYYLVELNENGKIQKKTGYEPNGNKKLRVETFEYDNQNLLKNRKVFGLNGELNREYEFEYDDKNNLIATKGNDGDGNLRVSEKFESIQYDEFGNWIEGWLWRNNKIVEFQKRTLNYSR